MRSVVVGGAGFLGSHMVDHLLARGDEVTVVDNLVAGQRSFVDPRAKFVQEDIGCSGFEWLNGCDRLYNYAAYPYVPDCYIDWARVFQVNATLALHLIERAQGFGVKRILQISSAELYGDVAGEISEDSPVQPHSTYGASKAAVDYCCQAAWRERKVPVMAIRQFNCIGERETHPYVVPEIIDQLKTSSVVRLGANTARDFMYAGDAVRIAAELLEKGQFGEVYNLGSGRATRVYDIATMLGAERVEQDTSRFRPWDIDSLCADCSKVNRVVPMALLPLKAALRKTADWARTNPWPWKRTKS